MKKQSTSRLTMKTAKAVAEKVLGTAKGLYKDPDVTNFDFFKMQMGMIPVRIQLDYSSGRVSVWINSIHMLLDPITLERDYNEEDIQNSKDRREEFDEWVGCHGPEHCKKQIDESWNRNRG